jgi:hypothetical protein
MLSKALVRHLIPNQEEEIEKVIFERIRVIKQLIEGANCAI